MQNSRSLKEAFDLKLHEFTLKFNLNVPFTTYYGQRNP